MERFTYPKPIKPQIVRDLDAIRRETRQDLKAGLPGAVADLAGFTAKVYVSTLLDALTEEEREEIREYNRQVTRYNAEVDRFNARQRAVRARQAQERQARANRREATAVRSAACPRCTMTHAGEC